MRAPFPYYGGKFYAAQRIIPYFPAHRCFVDAFGGAGNVILNKPPSHVEVWNDLNGEIYNFFKVLRENYKELVEKLHFTPYSREEYVACLEPSDDPLEQARRTFVKQTQGWSGKQMLTPGNWSYTIKQSHRGMAGNVSQFLSCVDNLQNVVLRLKPVQIENLPATEVVKRYDGEDTLFYCDPPYVSESRKSARSYDLEMTTEDHEELSESLHGVAGKVILSGYRCDLYDRLYDGWDSLEYDLVCCAQNRSNDRKTARRVEVIWANFPLESSQLTIPLDGLSLRG